MSIVRRGPRPKQYHVTDQRVLNDHRLPWAALGLLQYLCSRPDDWAVKVSYLGKTLKSLGRGAGRDKIYALLQVLTSLGYAQEIVKRDEQGRFKNREWVIFDTPLRGFTLDGVDRADSPDTAEPYPAEPDLVEPDPAKPTLLKTDSQTTTDSDDGSKSPTQTADAGGHEIPNLEVETLRSVAGSVVQAMRHGHKSIRNLEDYVASALKNAGSSVTRERINFVLDLVYQKNEDFKHKPKADADDDRRQQEAERKRADAARILEKLNATR